MLSDVDVLAGKGIIGHDPESRCTDRNGFRFTLVGTSVRFSRHDGTRSTKTSFLDESARRKSVNLAEIVFCFPLFFPVLEIFCEHRLLASSFLKSFHMKSEFAFI